MSGPVSTLTSGELASLPHTTEKAWAGFCAKTVVTTRHVIWVDAFSNCVKSDLSSLIANRVGRV